MSRFIERNLFRIVAILILLQIGKATWDIRAEEQGKGLKKETESTAVQWVETVVIDKEKEESSIDEEEILGRGDFPEIETVKTVETQKEARGPETTSETENKTGAKEGPPVQETPERIKNAQAIPIQEQQISYPVTEIQRKTIGLLREVIKSVPMQKKEEETEQLIQAGDRREEVLPEKAQEQLPDTIDQEEIQEETGDVYYMHPTEERIEETQNTQYTQHTHIYGNGIVILEPTCEASGIKEYTCIYCGEQKTETAPKYEHVYECGYCIHCGKYIGEHEHDMQLYSRVEPTCFENGQEVYRCSKCALKKFVGLEGKHQFDSQGICTVCGFHDDDIFRKYGRELRDSTLNEYERLLKVADFVQSNGHGDCIQMSMQFMDAAEEAGIHCEFRYVESSSCPVKGRQHIKEDFEENGICICGIGNNHHWVRAYLSDGFYEYDPQGLGNYCPGRNIPIR